MKRNRLSRPLNRPTASTAQPPHPLLPSAFWPLCAAVAVVVLAAHWPVLSAGALIFDDDQYLINNPLVRNPGWASVGQFFTEVLHPSTVAGYYQPLAMISLMLDVALGGSPENLLPFHVTSLTLHVVNTLLVVILLQLLFHRPIPAAAVGLLFGLHPITVESLPWIAERKTLLAAFFCLWCLIVYVRYTRRPTITRYLLCLTLYVLALMSKPTSLPLLILLLLLDFWPLNRFTRRAILEKLPLLAVAAAFACITLLSQARSASVIMPGSYPHGTVPLLVCHNIVFYLSKIFWPVHLSAFYPYPRPVGLHDPSILAGLIGTAVLLLTLIISLRWTRVFLVGWLFFFLAILPTMGIVAFANTIAADRFVYLPIVGLLLIAAHLLARAWDAAAGRPRPRAARGVLIAAVLVLAGAETVQTRNYLFQWKDSETIYAYMVQQAPASEALHYNYAELLARRGRLDEAAAHYAEAIRLNPIFAEPLVNLAWINIQQQRPADALPLLERALKLEPDMDYAWLNLASALTHLGRHDEACTRLDQACRRLPDNVNLRLSLIRTLISVNRTRQAIDHCADLLDRSPTLANASAYLDNDRAYLADVHACWGQALLRESKTAEAVTHLQKAVDLRPDRPDFRALLTQATRTPPATAP